MTSVSNQLAGSKVSKPHLFSALDLAISVISVLFKISNQIWCNLSSLSSSIMVAIRRVIWILASVTGTDTVFVNLINI